MATTKKAKSTKKAPAKTAPKASAKKSSAKKKSALDLNRTIKANPGMDEFFYQKFPRFAAYQILVKAKGHKMTVGTFLKKIEALPKVENRKQALGIVQKLVDKKRHVGAVCASFVK